MNIQANKQAAVDAANETLLISAKLEAGTVNAMWEGQYNMLNAVAIGLSNYESRDLSPVTQRMERLTRASDFSYMAYAFEDGICHASNGQTYDISQREYFKHSMTGQRSVLRIDEPFTGDDCLIVQAVPIERDGVRLGIVLGVYTETHLIDLIIPPVYEGQVYSLICREDGYISVGSNNKNFMSKAKNVFDVMEDVDTGEKDPIEDIKETIRRKEAGFATYTVEGHRRYAVYVPLKYDVATGESLVMVNSVPADYISDIAQKTVSRNTLLFMFVVIACTVTYIIFFTRSNRSRKNLEAERDKLRISESQINVAIASSGTEIARYDLKTGVYYNRSEKLYNQGYGDVITDVPEEFIRSGLVAKESVDEFRSFYNGLRRGENRPLVCALRLPDGQFNWFRKEATFVCDENGEPYQAIILYKDITDEIEQEAVYARWQQSMQSKDPSSYTVFRCNLSKNSSFDSMEGSLLNVYFEPSIHSFDERTKQYAGHFVHLDDYEAYMSVLNSNALLANYYRGKRAMSLEYRERLTGDGSDYRWIKVTLEMAQLSSSDDVMLFALYENVDDTKNAELSMQQLLESDSLTGILNRAAFIEHFNELTRRKQPDATHALILIDIDNFRRLNECFGHAVGDHALVDIAGSLKSIVKPNEDILGRLGGDNFLLCLKNVANKSVVEQKAIQIQSLLRKVFSVDIMITASLGIAMYPEDGRSFNELYHGVDMALYTAKSTGSDAYAFYSGDTRDDSKKAAVNSLVPTTEQNDGKTLRKVFERTGTVVAEYDCFTGRFSYGPDISKYIYGIFDDRALWRILMSDTVADPMDVKAMQLMVSDLSNDSYENSASMDVMLKTPQMVKHWFTMTAFKRMNDLNVLSKIIITFLDVNDEILASKKLRFQAEHDMLTGLYNRSTFLKLVEETVKDKPPGSYMLLCCNINDFRFINERFGREEGDKLLKYSADKLLVSSENLFGFAGRLGNDIFAQLLPNKPGRLDIVRNAVKDFFADYPLNARIAGRSGIYVIEDPSISVDSMLDMAVTASQTIRGRFDSYIAMYDDSMNEKRLMEKYVGDRMEEALEAGEFVIYIQPQVHHSTGKIVGAESLVRWIDPNKGVVPPGEFIPIMEKNGFITKLDEYVWDKTAYYLSAWLHSGNKPVPVSVNVSREDTNDPMLCEKLLAIVKKHDIPIELFRLEITESLFATDTKRLRNVVDKLHQCGFLVEMDDFGSGYSSLNILQDIPVDVLKLDMRFFDMGENAGRGGLIVNAVLRMARWLNMPVIAEGVEDKEKADFLLSVGCPTIQGYLYERPIPVDEFERKFHKNTEAIATYNDPIVEEVNILELWNPSSSDSNLFHNVIGPAVIYEYHQGKFEILRANNQFLDALNLETSTALPHDAFAAIIEDDKQRLKEATEAAIGTKKNQSLNVTYEFKDGQRKEFAVSLRVAYTSKDRAVVFATIA